MTKVPDWFPGPGFKRIAREWNEVVEKMISALFQFFEGHMVNDSCSLRSFHLIML